MPLPTHHAEAPRSCFGDVFECRGMESSGLSRGAPGVSDGIEGFQANAGSTRDGPAWLGVNLEDTKYGDRPVAPSSSWSSPVRSFRPDIA